MFILCFDGLYYFGINHYTMIWPFSWRTDRESQWVDIATPWLVSPAQSSGSWIEGQGNYKCLGHLASLALVDQCGGEQEFSKRIFLISLVLRDTVFFWILRLEGPKTTLFWTLFYPFGLRLRTDFTPKEDQEEAKEPGHIGCVVV